MDFGGVAEELGISVEEYLEILELYIDTTGKDLEALTSAVFNKDTNAAHAASHAIKGASGNLKLMELYEAAKAIDDTVRVGALDGVEDRLRILHDLYKHVVMEIKKFQNSLRKQGDG